MRMFVVPLVVAALSGCAFHVRLLEDGKTHRGSFDPIGGKMSVLIDGDAYAGPLTRGAQPGFMVGFAGNRMMTGTVIGGLDQFQSLMTNRAGTILRCQIQASAGRGQGVCQNNAGRTYDVLVGDDGTTGMFIR
jgi:hypothetical protein